MKRMMAGILTFCLFLGVVSVASAARKRPPLEYYNSVHQRNLFRPLGWAPPDNRPQYTLIGTALSVPEEEESQEADFWGAIMGRTQTKKAEGPPRPDRALIQQNGGNVFYIAVGDKVNNLTVEKIEIGRVTLKGEKPEESQTLSLQNFSFGGGGGNSGGGGPRMGPPAGFTPPAGGFRPGGNFQMPAGGPADWQQRLQNMSPEEREQMRQRFQQGGGNFGGGGNRGGGGGGRGGGR